MDWFYHDPGQGRVGPLSADDMRARWRDRRLLPDTLVWRHGLPEWQPLARVADELALHAIEQDMAAPPPLPPRTAPPAMPSSRHAPPPEKRGPSGCLIALIVAGVLAVPMLAILAAIALPAYNDYTIRAKVTQHMMVTAAALKAPVAEARNATGRCPASFDDLGLPAVPNTTLGSVDGACAFEITAAGVHPRIDGTSIVFVQTDTGWDCSGGSLAPKYRPMDCRAPDTAR